MVPLHCDQFVRLEKARALGAAISACEPRDAVIILAAALDDLGAGMPDFDLWSGVREQAGSWASFAHPAELEAYFGAALRRLGGTPLGICARKRLIVTLWRSLNSSDRGAFLRFIDAEAA